MSQVEDEWSAGWSGAVLALSSLVSSLLVLALVLLLVVRARAHTHRRKAQHDSSKDDKCHTPLNKVTEDNWKSCSCASEEKCLDIIPGIAKEGVGLGEEMQWRNVSVDDGMLAAHNYSRHKLSSPAVCLPQELSLQPTLLQEFSAVGLHTSRQTNV